MEFPRAVGNPAKRGRHSAETANERSERAASARHPSPAGPDGPTVRVSSRAGETPGISATPGAGESSARLGHQGPGVAPMVILC